MRRAAAPQRRRLLRILLVRLGPLSAEAGGRVPSQMSTRRARKAIAPAFARHCRGTADRVRHEGGLWSGVVAVVGKAVAAGKILVIHQVLFAVLLSVFVG